ncbi:MAG: tetratricopeptide repeat protein, partial [Chloroflexota bacterium]
ADLAYHCEKAGLVEKARDHLLDAANTAKGEYRNAHAIDLLSRALNLTSDEDFETKFEILLERGEIFAYQGQLEEQRTDLESLDNMLKTTEESLIKSQYNVYQSEIAIKWADHYVEVGQYEQTIEITQKIISSAEETNIPNNLVDAFFFWAISLFQQGHYEDAEQKGIIGLTHANSVDDLDGEIRILNLLGLIALVTDKSNKAQDYFLRSLGMAEKVGNLRDQARALNNLGNLSLSGGNFDSAKDYYLRSLTFVRKIGDLPREGLVLSNIGYIAGVQGDYIKAKDYYDRSLLNVRQVGDRVQEAYGLINSSSIYRALNEFTQALSLARLGLSITQETGDRNWEAWAFTSLGHTLFEIGNLEEAAESYKNAVDLRSSMQQENLVCEPLAGLARIALQKADLAEALTYINPILEYLEKGGTFEGTDEPIRVYLTCYQVLRDGEDPRANDILQAGYRLLQTRGDGIKNDVMRNEFYNNIPHNKELLSEWNSIQE